MVGHLAEYAANGAEAALAYSPTITAGVKDHLSVAVKEFVQLLNDMPVKDDGTSIVQSPPQPLPPRKASPKTPGTMPKRLVPKFSPKTIRPQTTQIQGGGGANRPDDPVDFAVGKRVTVQFAGEEKSRAEDLPPNMVKLKAVQRKIFGLKIPDVEIVLAEVADT